MSNITVDIAVATFKRPDFLGILLDSLIQLQVKQEVSFRIIVIDNDINGTASATVKNFMQKTSWPILYEIEPQQNIALARNRGLKLAEAKFVAFIDDDEYVDQDWLQTLLNCSQNFAADVVFGPVIPIYPKGAPKWIRKGNYFSRARYPTGTKRDRGFTGNALVQLNTLIEGGFSFNQEYGITGGSDSELFYRLNKTKVKMVWCDEALAYEEVLTERMNIKWLIRRAFRGGQTFARIHVVDMSTFQKFRWVFRRIFLLVLAMMGLFLWPLREKWGMVALRKVASNIGQLCWNNRSPFKEYEQTSG